MSAENPFVHLHVHTEYSLLDGLSKINKIVDRAKELGMPALAITDHGTMFGVIDFYRACKKAGIKPIIGMEGYLATRTMRDKDPKHDSKPYHLLMLAQNNQGYGNLLKIASAAQLEGYYYRPRIDRPFLEAHKDGIITTSGCLAAEIPQFIMAGQDDKARARIDEYLQIFGRDHFYLELQNHDIEELRQVNTWLIETAKKDNVRLVATADVHYILESDYDAHDTLLCIQSSALKTDENRLKMSDNSYFLIHQQKMWDWFGHINDGEALKNTLAVAEMCDIDLERKGYHLPVFPVPEGFTETEYLRHLCEKGLRWRYGDRVDTDPKLRERLAYELGVVDKMGFNTYFLIVWDLCEFARHADIWWNVRGSGAGSVAAYSLGITNIDPIQNNLLFERFLNPGRVSMPDIDMDFPDDRRAELISYAVRKYGEDKVAAIITFGTLGAKAAVRDVGRALNLDLSIVNEAARLIPTEPKPKPVHQYVDDNPELKSLYDNNPEIRAVIDTAAKLQGVNRHASTHAAGVIIADKPLHEYLPLHRQTKGGEKSDRDRDEDEGEGDAISLKLVTQFPMETCESIGLLKVDFLGLSTLTIMRRACDLILKHHGEKYTMDNIPYRPTGDPEKDRKLRETFEMVGRGETVGVFQVESTGMQQMLREMRPTKFEHIIAAVSLYRPGPMDYIPTFNARMHGREVVNYHHPLLENILSETYGIMVYQEQIMQVASELFGYPLGEADLMRRAVSKKKKEDLLKHKEIFKQRGPEVDPTITVEVAEKIFDDIEFFANYGFNKCLVGSTEIIDAATGRVVTIDNLMSGAAKLTNTVSLNTDTLKLESRPITNVMFNGAKPVYRLTTQLGRQIDATDNHPFYTFEGWRNLGQLTEDDQIAVPRRIPVEGQNIWADHRLVALGHLLAEGNLCHTSGVYYYTTDDAQLADYVRHVEQFANTQAVVSRHHNAYSVYTKRADRSTATEIVTWIQELGLWGKDSYTKFIPDDVFTLTNYCIALLISRMWEGDGHINTKDRSLFYATSSIRMARQLQHLLLRMGIISKLRKVNFAYKDGRVGYQVFITGNTNLRAFRDHVASHFVSEERRAKLDSLALDAPQSLGVKDVIPMGVKTLIRTAQEKSGVKWRDVHAQTGIATREFSPTSNPTKSGFARETIARLGEFFDADDLRAHAHSDIYWDKVVSIEYIGEQPTYDLTISETHNFIANDIIVHNSHAADYAVITVQTAFLKAHYTAEYMAALLSVYYDAPDKMAILLDECRRLNIPLLPPSINYSSLDFDIQRDEHDKPGIRFGLAAIKNAGIGALTPIIHERETNGIFADLENFCQRVDLRPVGKRTIESLIKVGAFDSMGTRTQLLAALERIVSHSADQHKAKEIGQASLFGDTVSMSDELLKNLPNVEPPTHRETLDWEKELLGIYVSEHPIDAMMDSLRHMNITTSDVIKSADPSMNNTPIRFVALISGMRKMPTKNKDMMCIAALEDRFGTIDGVMFPRTWNKFHDMLVEGGVYLFMGKLDLSRGNPQIIIEDVTQQLEAIYSDSAAQNFDDNQPSWFKYDESHNNGGSSPAMRAAAQTVERAFNAPMSGSSLPSEEPPSPPAIDYDNHVLDTTLPDDPPEWATNPDWQPYDQEASDEKRQPRMLTIRFHRGTNENRRYAKVVAEVKSFPGIDSFEIILVENDEDTHLIEFPDKTNYCDALIEKLRKISGVEIVEHNDGS